MVLCTLELECRGNGRFVSGGTGGWLDFPSRKVPLQAEEFRKARIQRMKPEMKAEVDVEQRPDVTSRGWASQDPRTDGGCGDTCPSTAAFLIWRTV